MDMLVRLYNLPAQAPLLQHQQQQAITVRRALSLEKNLASQWMAKTFGGAWPVETEIAFARMPVAVWIATYEEKLVGVSVYDNLGRGMFGPIGVHESMRGKGTGKALLVATLHDMYAQGYIYAIIGGVGPAEFYAKAVGAEPIADSEPGLYRGMLKEL